MKTTIARTYRLSPELYTLISQSAEHERVSEADLVRLILRDYFQKRQSQTQLELLEQRLLKQIDSHAERIVALQRQILSLAS